ncbi:MAG: hypothetical protein U0324_17070 [Polyangiales bacterium]
MRRALAALLLAACAAAPPAPRADDNVCPPPSRPAPRPRAFEPRDCDCAALCAPCPPATTDANALAAARGRCPAWHLDCACPVCPTPTR